MSGNHGIGEYGVLRPAKCKVNGREIDGPVLCVTTGAGVLVASFTGDPGVYDEIGIDLVEKDGSIIQLAVVGIGEKDGGCHVYAYDGKSEEVAQATNVTIDANSIRY